MKQHRIIVAGGRDFNNYELLREKVNAYTIFLEPMGDLEIVSGGQKTVDETTGEMYGADYLGECYADNNGIPIKRFEAKWTKHGKAAGPIRNKEMAAYATHLIAFWDGVSNGTKKMIEEAKAAGLKIRIVRY